MVYIQRCIKIFVQSFLKKRIMLEGFTLAEILITLGIIGIVAAMTIPALVTNYHKKHDLALLKTTYSILSQAFLAGSQDVNFYGTQPAEIVENLKPYVKYNQTFVTNESGFAKKAMCYSPERKSSKRVSSYYWLGGVCGVSTPITQVKASIELQNGACIGFSNKNSLIITDTNGSYNPPNQFGRDVFVFQITSNNTIVPYGFGAKYPDTIINASGGCRKENYNCGASEYCAARIQKEGWQINYY